MHTLPAATTRRPIDFKYFLEFYCSLLKLRFKARGLSQNLEKDSCAWLTYGLKELMFRRQWLCSGLYRVLNMS